MDIGEYLYNLNLDVAREVAAMLQYDIAAENVTGEAAPALAAMFREHSKDERKHRGLLYGIIIARGGVISPEVSAPLISLQNNAIFVQVKNSELLAGTEYDKRIRQAQELGFADDVYILSKIRADETHHLTEIQTVLGG